jgi:hypothetical protein
MNPSAETDRASPQLLFIASLIHGFALVTSFLIYPIRIVHTTTFTQAIWQCALIVAALSTVALLLVVLRYSWQTIQRRCSVVLLGTALATCAGFATLWFHYHSIMLRMP